MGSTPSLPPGATFREASAAVLGYLHGEHSGSWAVTRTVDGDHEVVLALGEEQVPQAGEILTEPAALYVPLRDASGEVMGGLWRLPAPAGSLETAERAVEPTAPPCLLELLAQLLSVLLTADRAHVATARRTELLQLEANSDELTGLPNRRGWRTVLDLEEARYAQGAGHGSVIVIDLDRLKVVNDEQGHVAGDEHLQLAAVTLAAALRETDFVARLGGDEFGVLVSGPTTPEETQHLLRRIRAAFAAAGVGASMGYATYTAEGGLHRTWWRADREMYLEKQRHRAVLDLRGTSRGAAQALSTTR
ncbi:MAG TPA: GGDEF domain-containing protein [Actinomycetales bacterium]|nr:GGDEF domain-containing protein [Actinomycetales bacterium]